MTAQDFYVRADFTTATTLTEETIFDLLEKLTPIHASMTGKAGGNTSSVAVTVQAWTPERAAEIAASHIKAAAHETGIEPITIHTLEVRTRQAFKKSNDEMEKRNLEESHYRNCTNHNAKP